MAGSLSDTMDLRLILMLFMNSVSNVPSKEERLKYFFNIIDSEENRMITFDDL